MVVKVNFIAGIVMRAILGFVGGGYSVICPMYIVELAPNSVRSAFGVLPEFGVLFGGVVANFVAPSIGYMGVLGLNSSIAFLQFFLLFLIPESPSVYVIRAQVQNRKERKTDGTQSNKVRDSIFQRKYLKNLITGIGALVLQQFCGNSPVIANLAPIMAGSGIDLHPCYQAGIVTSGQDISSLFGGFVISRIGRKKTWIISSSGVVVFLTIFSLNSHYKWANWLALLSLFLYGVIYDIGMGPIPWFIMPEYFPSSVRAQGTSIATSCSWVFKFTVIFLWPVLDKHLGAFGLMVFAGVTCFAIVFGAVMIYEPKPLADLDHSDISPGGEGEEDHVSNDVEEV
jgi:MFS family permease